MKTVVIIDDDVELSEKLADAVNSHPGFEVVAKAIGSRDAWLFIEHYSPDVIIMDIIMPDDDGIRLIKRIYERYYDNYQPYLFVITAVNTSSVERMLFDLEVDFVQFKPVNEFLLKDVLDRISSDTERVKKSYHPYKNSKIDISDMMEDTLYEIGVKPQVFGYMCIKTALLLIFDNPNERPQIYKEVPSILNVSKNSVDKNIRRTVNSCVGSELYRHLFGEHPVSNLDFLYGLAMYIKKQLRGSGRKIDSGVG